ncbi:protein obstructor-E-like [Saccostrea cucullata]|uniref:protein obstructor-E-like n=1 Tax=Saccostrea cuccullata TaxID=36930 RepID=UPI002ED6B30D
MLAFVLLILSLFSNLTYGKSKSCVHGSLSPHPTDCTMYQACVHGYQMNMTCPYGTAWHQKNSTCADAAEVRCKLQDDKGDEYAFSCPSTFGEFPDPKNCTKYYICSYGTATSMVCQKNTGWDPKLKLCNHLSNLSKCP